MLEELLDGGFLMNWIEKLFSSTSLATVIAVILQTAILVLGILMIFQKDQLQLVLLVQLWE